MRNFSPSAANGGLTDLLERPRFEVLPNPGAPDGVAGHVPPGSSVAVSASPTKGLAATLEVSVQLAGLGYDVVPSLAAQPVEGGADLAESVDRLHEAGIIRVFVPSGDAVEAGAYPDAVALLQVMDAMDTTLRSVGITAYRESHPTTADDLTIQGMWDKRRFAAQMASNLTLNANVVDLWLTRVRARCTTRPLSPGIVARLVTPRGFNAVRFLRRLAPALTRDESVVAGFHDFAFNQFAATEARRFRLIERLRKGGARTRSAPRGLATPRQL